VRTLLLTEGRVQDPFRDADAHYRRLLARHQPVEVLEARDSADLVAKLPREGRVVALDREGSMLDSVGWSRWLDQRRLEARDLCLAIGGADGLPADARRRADERISLGPITLPHQLARVVVLEQLFRASKILAGEPYHR
jgi:23S rRNA (pseudouridine1915-N3)-methyltransferase